MTQAEEYNRASIALDEEATETLLESATIHHTHRQETVLEWDDGSIYYAEDENEQHVFSSMSEFLESISGSNEVDADNLTYEEPLPSNIRISTGAGWVEVSGTVERDDLGFGEIDLPLRLTRMIRNGAPYLLGSTDYHEDPSDTAAIAYTTQLASLIGKRVTVRCQPSTYHEERATTRGNPYHVDVEYLDAPTIMSSVDRNMEGDKEIVWEGVCDSHEPVPQPVRLVYENGKYLLEWCGPLTIEKDDTVTEWDNEYDTENIPNACRDFRPPLPEGLGGYIDDLLSGKAEAKVG